MPRYSESPEIESQIIYRIISENQEEVDSLVKSAIENPSVCHLIIKLISMVINKLEPEEQVCLKTLNHVIFTYLRIQRNDHSIDLTNKDIIYNTFLMNLMSAESKPLFVRISDILFKVGYGILEIPLTSTEIKSFFAQLKQMEHFSNVTSIVSQNLDSVEA
jgi:hypothetical protein